MEFVNSSHPALTILMTSLMPTAAIIAIISIIFAKIFETAKIAKFIHVVYYLVHKHNKTI